jgi:hypothetical protein
MKILTGLCSLFLLTVGMSLAQSGTMNQSGGTINNMSQTPDINQRLVGQQPPSGSGGIAGGNPDTTDRVNGKAYPVAGSAGTGQSAAAANAGSATTNSSGVNPNTGQPLNDKAAVAAAKKGIAVLNNSPEGNPPKTNKNMTPSPGANAASRGTTNPDQTNQKRR